MMKHFILTQKYLPSTPSSADVANPAADVAFTLTPWEVAMASQPCFPTALLYGSGVYTTWRSNSAPNWVHAHLKRLQHHCHQLGWPWPLSSEHPALQAEHTPATLFQQLYQAL